jgi:hypothetical protein
LRKRLSKRPSNMHSSAGSSMGGSFMVINTGSRNTSSNTKKINTRRDSIKILNQAQSRTGLKKNNLKGSRTFNLPNSKDENILRIADENDETFDRDMTTATDPWMTGVSKGFSLYTTPRNAIVTEASEKTARIQRAYRKHSINMTDWSQTIIKFNNHRK